MPARPSATGSKRVVRDWRAVPITWAGRLRPSETSATITGVIAAPISVPPPHSRETTSAAASEERLAIVNVVTERPDWAFLRFWLTSAPTVAARVALTSPPRSAERPWVLRLTPGVPARRGPLLEVQVAGRR